MTPPSHGGFPDLPWLSKKQHFKKSQLFGKLTNVHFSALGSEMLDFSHWAQPADCELETREKFIQTVSSIVEALWSSADVQVYGSCATGLSLPSSDIDFVILGVESVEADFLQSISQSLQENGMRNVQVLPNAKIPLVKFIDSQSNLNGDMCFGVVNAKPSISLVLDLLEEYPLAKPLIMVTKTLLKQNNLSLVLYGGLSSYAITLIVVSFLKSKAKANFEATPVAVGKSFVEFLAFFSSMKAHTTFSPVSINIKDVITTNHSQRHLPSLISLKDPLDCTNDITRGSYYTGCVQRLMWCALHALYSFSPDMMPSLLSSFINPADLNFVYRFQTFEAEEELLLNSSMAVDPDYLMNKES